MLRIKVHSWLLSSLLGLVFLLPVAQAATDCAAVTEIPTMECEALLALYDSTDGANWSDKTGWNLTNTPCSTPWYGVQCAGGHVTRLYLWYNNLSGTLPAEIDKLTMLQVLRLESNDICGEVSASVMDLTHIFYANLNDNNLTASPTVKTWLEGKGPWDDATQTPGECTTGPGICATVTEIPPTECAALVSIYNESTNGEQWNDNTDWLDTNTPCSWHGVQCGGGHVTRLNLYYNNLTHALSSQIEKLTMLQVLHLEYNELCGVIPSSLMNLSNLWYLNINYNHLSTTDNALKDWLDVINPGWELTQTPCGGPVGSTLQFNLTGYTVNEDGEQAVITVTRTGDSSGAASVDYGTTDDTATAGSDYTAKIGTLNWADMDTDPKLIKVDITDDTDLEGDETFVVSLGNAVGAELGAPDTAIVTIIDNEMPFCETITGMDKSECEALVAIYNSTNGDQWNDNTNWTVTTTPCDWFGVTCGGGHVTRLYLWYNNLSGTLPAEIDQLVYADVIRFEHNEICGEVPPSVMSLDNPPLWYMDINYNHLTASNPVKAWLNDILPGWNDTQTPCP